MTRSRAQSCQSAWSTSPISVERCSKKLGWRTLTSARVRSSAPIASAYSAQAKPGASSRSSANVVRL